MTLLDLLKLLLRYWRSIVLLTLIGAALALAATAAIQPKYQANAQLFVATAQSSNTNPVGLNQGGEFTLGRVKSYAELISSTLITGPVIRELHLRMTPQELDRELSGTAPLGTVLINIAVTDSKRARAQRIANAVARQFIAVVSRLEATTTRSGSPVKIELAKEAYLPTSPVTPRPLVNLMLGMILGFVLGAGLAIVRARRNRKARSADEVERVLRENDTTPVGSSVPSPRIVETYPDPHNADEPFRYLTSYIQFGRSDSGARSLVLTSPRNAAETADLAKILGAALAGNGLSTLVVDAMISAPYYGNYFTSGNAKGLTGILRDEESISGAIVDVSGNGSLHFLPSGTVIAQAPALFNSGKMRRTLKVLEETFDVVLVATPPMIGTSDGVALAAQIGEALIAVRDRHTLLSDIEESLKILAAVNTSVVGAVFIAKSGK